MSTQRMIVSKRKIVSKRTLLGINLLWNSNRHTVVGKVSYLCLRVLSEPNFVYMHVSFSVKFGGETSQAIGMPDRPMCRHVVDHSVRN